MPGEVALSQGNRPPQQVHEHEWHEQQRKRDVPTLGGERADVAHAQRVGNPESEQPDRADRAGEREEHVRPAPPQPPPDHPQLAPDEQDHRHAGGSVRPDDEARIAVGDPEAEHAGRKRREERGQKEPQVDTSPHRLSD